jgi:hypothetical protein
MTLETAVRDTPEFAETVSKSKSANALMCCIKDEARGRKRTR